eukprot:9084-Heterococcus_DN1.PRE.1
MAAAAQYPGDQTLSKEAAERLISRSTQPVPASENNGIEGGVKFCYDLRLRAYSNTYMGEDSVLAFLANIQCNCLLLTGQT